MKNAGLPIVQLSVLRPFINELRQRGMDASLPLVRVGLSFEAIADSGQAVHAMVIHQLLENIAGFAEDPVIAAKIGEKLDTTGWPLLADAGVHAKTLGDFLTRYISQANEIASSAVQYLHIEGAQAVLGERRTFEPSIIPAQNDAFMASLAISILRRSVADQLNPSEIMVAVSDPHALPPGYGIMQILKGDRLGFRLLFPTKWLSMPFQWDRYQKVENQEKLAAIQPSELVFGFRQVLRSYVGRGRLTAIDAARLVHMNRQKLGRMLARHGTSISAEIGQAQIIYAKKRLASGDNVTEIALALGYSTPGNFTRLFKRLSGVSPREYQKSSNQKSYV